MDAIRVRHYSRRTEETYLHWIKRYIYFHNKRHPEEMAEREVAAFLTYLAVQKNVAASTQNIALNALVFMYRHVLDHPLKDIHGLVRAKKPQKLPVVLTQIEVAKVLSKLNGVHWLIACLQYGSGLRLIESVRLRVMDIDFDRRAIFVRNGKGGKDRVVTLADEVIKPIQRHLETVITLHERDLQEGLVVSICRMLWPVSTQPPTGSGNGSIYFLHQHGVSIRVPGLNGVIISTKAV
ncbi:MAG: phage integrase N-terminal SAM-like domain-containing protein [Candidatus Thiodiazotropha endolucinida]